MGDGSFCPRQDRIPKVRGVEVQRYAEEMARSQRFSGAGVVLGDGRSHWYAVSIDRGIIKTAFSERISTIVDSFIVKEWFNKNQWL